jgi:hypothetical protein
MNMNMVRKISLVVALASCLSGTANAVNLVQNGSFSSGDFTSWSNYVWGVGSAGTFGLQPDTGNTHFAYTGCIGTWCMTPGGAYISQTLTTTPGQTYDLSFSLSNYGGPPNEISAHWGITQVFDLPNWAANTTWGASTPSYNDYTVTGLVATGTSTTLTFNGRQDPGYVALDNISVVNAPVPEPTTYAMLLAGLGLIGFVAYRRKDDSSNMLMAA